MIQFRDFSKTKNVWSIPCDKQGEWAVDGF